MLDSDKSAVWFRLRGLQPHPPLLNALSSSTLRPIRQRHLPSHIRRRFSPLPQAVCVNSHLARYRCVTQTRCHVHNPKLSTHTENHRFIRQGGLNGSSVHVCRASQGLLAPGVGFPHDEGGNCKHPSTYTQRAQHLNKLLKNYIFTTAIGSLLIAMALSTVRIVAQVLHALSQMFAPMSSVPFVPIFLVSTTSLPPKSTSSASTWLSWINPNWDGRFWTVWGHWTFGLAVLLGVAFLVYAYISVLLNEHQAKSLSGVIMNHPQLSSLKHMGSAIQAAIHSAAPQERSQSDEPAATEKQSINPQPIHASMQPSAAYTNQCVEDVIKADAVSPSTQPAVACLEPSNTQYLPCGGNNGEPDNIASTEQSFHAGAQHSPVHVLGSAPRLIW